MAPFWGAFCFAGAVLCIGYAIIQASATNAPRAKGTEMVLSFGFIGFLVVMAFALGYVSWRIVTGKGFPDQDAVFVLMMSPIGGFLLGCIVGNIVVTFGVIVGAIICGVFSMVIITLAVQNRKA